jgi:hypothetical protein
MITASSFAKVPQKGTNQMSKQKLDCLKPFDVAGSKSADVVSASRLFPGALLQGHSGSVSVNLQLITGQSGSLGGKK